MREQIKLYYVSPSPPKITVRLKINKKKHTRKLHDAIPLARAQETT